MSIKCDARAYELLKAALDIFEHQREGGYWDAIACTAKYDGTDCDVFNLYADITACLRKHDEENGMSNQGNIVCPVFCKNCGHSFPDEDLDDNPDLYSPPAGTLWCDYNSRYVPDDGYCFWGYEEAIR